MPVVTFDWPPDDAFFDWGDEIAWNLHVTDAEDGSTTDGGIPPAEVLLEVLLGHATRSHGLSQTHGGGDHQRLRDGTPQPRSQMLSDTLSLTEN